MRTIFKLVVVAATALVAVAGVSVVSTGEAGALPPSTSVLVLAPASSSVPIPPSTRTPRPPLACSQLLILDAVQVRHGVHAKVVGESVCNPAPTSLLIPLSTCLQYSKNGVNFWHNSTCMVRTGSGARSLVQRPKATCAPIWWRTNTTFSEGGKLTTAATFAVELSCL
jgi:hypothetical protein